MLCEGYDAVWEIIFAYIKADILVAAARKAADLVADITKPT
jgi:hypothetical protein